MRLRRVYYSEDNITTFSNDTNVVQSISNSWASCLRVGCYSVAQWTTSKQRMTRKSINIIASNLREQSAAANMDKMVSPSQNTFLPRHNFLTTQWLPRTSNLIVFNFCALPNIINYITLRACWQGHGSHRRCVWWTETRRKVPRSPENSCSVIWTSLRHRASHQARPLPNPAASSSSSDLSNKWH